MREISSKDFYSYVEESKSKFVLHFWAEWNGYDLEQNKNFEAIESEFQEINFYRMNIDVEENKQLCELHKVMGPPTIVFYKNGKLIERIVGVLSESELKNKICVLYQTKTV